MKLMSTPHASTSIAPANILLRASNRARLLFVRPTDERDELMLERAKLSDAKAKETMKVNGNLRRHAGLLDLRVGDNQFFNQDKGQKKTKNTYHEVRFRVKAVKHSMIFAESETGHILVRNARFFKRHLDTALIEVHNKAIAYRPVD